MSSLIGNITAEIHPSLSLHCTVFTVALL
jgi:hypothetical protein